MRRILSLFFILLFCDAEIAYCQKMGTISFRGKDSQIIISNSTIDSLRSNIKNASNDQYAKAWGLATISELYLFLNNSALANKYYADAIIELKKMSADSICNCVIELNALSTSQYGNLKNGFSLEIPTGFNDVAIQALTSSNFKHIDNLLIYFLTNNAADAWKYNFPKAMDYFEKLRTIATPIIQRDILSPNASSLEMVKDPMRRYLRFMYNAYFTSGFKQLCTQSDCLEKAWIATQLLKSRTFKSQIFKNELSSLNKVQFAIAMNDVTFLDSVYTSDYYYKNIVSNNFQLNFPLQRKIDSVKTDLIKIMPSYELLISDKINRNGIRQTLKANETYISIMYTDNERYVYAWKFEKNKEPLIIKLDIKSLDLFFRVEYFRNEKINHPSEVNLYDQNNHAYKYDLTEFEKTFHKTKLEPLSNERYLYTKVIRPLSLPKGNKIVLEVDQNLGAFPVGLLRDSLTGKYLFEDYSFTYTPSASIFYYLRNKNSITDYSSDYIGFSFNENKNSFVDSIIRESSKNFTDKSQLHFGSTESQLYSTKAIDSCKYLHLTCHNDLTNKMFRLVFNSDDINDGLVSETEIIDSLKNNAMLTALTSCTTAPYLDEYDFIKVFKTDSGQFYFAGESCVCSIGETFSNITSAFFAAGSHKLLVTQWEIPDSEISAKFMSDFFKNISKGFDFDLALKASQIKFSKDYDIQYWGGYILVGD